MIDEADRHVHPGDRVRCLACGALVFDGVEAAGCEHVAGVWCLDWQESWIPRGRRQVLDMDQGPRPRGARRWDLVGEPVVHLEEAEGGRFEVLPTWQDPDRLRAWMCSQHLADATPCKVSVRADERGGVGVDAATAGVDIGAEGPPADRPWPWDGSGVTGVPDWFAFYAPLHLYAVDDWGTWLHAPRFLAAANVVAQRLASEPEVALRLLLVDVLLHEFYHHLEERALTELEVALTWKSQQIRGCMGIYGWHVTSSPQGPIRSNDVARERVDPLSEALANAFAFRRLSRLRSIRSVPAGARRRYLQEVPATWASAPPGYRSAGEFVGARAFLEGELRFHRRCLMPRASGAGPARDPNDALRGWEWARDNVEIVGRGFRPSTSLRAHGSGALPLHVWGTAAERAHLHPALVDAEGAFLASRADLERGPLAPAPTLVDVSSWTALAPARALRRLGSPRGQREDHPEEADLMALLGEPPLVFPTVTSACGGATGWQNGDVTFAGRTVGTWLASVTDVEVRGEVAVAIGLDGRTVEVDQDGSVHAAMSTRRRVALHGMDR